MDLDQKTVEYIAGLARLSLTAQEKQKFLKELAAIIEYVKILQAAPTAGVEATAQVFPPASSGRPDEVAPGLSQAELLQNAPQTAKQHFGLPKMFS